MVRLRDIVGDDGLGYETAVPTARAKTVNDEVQAQVRRYEQECGPVVTRPYIEWLEPRATSGRGYGAPVVALTKTGLHFNRLAVELLGRPTRVYVGVTVSQEIAIKPAPDGKGYALSVNRKNGSASAGRNALTRRLEEKGLRQGWYRLDLKNEKLGVFIGRRVETNVGAD